MVSFDQLFCHNCYFQESTSSLTVEVSEPLDEKEAQDESSELVEDEEKPEEVAKTDN